MATVTVWVVSPPPKVGAVPLTTGDVGPLALHQVRNRAVNVLQIVEVVETTSEREIAALGEPRMLIAMVALSLSTMVPVATKSPSTGVWVPDGLESVTVTVSSFSSIESPETVATVTVWVVWPAAEGDGAAQGAGDVGPLSRAGRNRVVDALRVVRGGGAREREHEIAALGHRGVVDRDGGAVVVDDGAGGDRLAEHRRLGARRVGERDGDGLVVLVIESQTVATVTVWVVWPATKVTVPLKAPVMSDPSAVPVATV